MPQTDQKSLLAQLPSQCIVSLDDRMRFFVEWWLRMHEGIDPLVAIALKFVEWAEDHATARRFVWEVCRWPQVRAPSWTFVCWMIDGEGMWLKEFSSKRAAIAYFRQAPADVLDRPVRTATAPPYAAAS